MKKVRVWFFVILLILQCCISGCAQSDNSKHGAAGVVSTTQTTTTQTATTQTATTQTTVSTTASTAAQATVTATTSNTTRAQTTVTATTSNTTRTQTTANTTTLNATSASRFTVQTNVKGKFTIVKNAAEMLDWIQNDDFADCAFKQTLRRLNLEHLLSVQSSNEEFTLECIDSNGNFYLAIGTNWHGADAFWDMGVERSRPYRRMLVKLDKDGNFVYKVPLSAKGMAVDQVFGIHIKDDSAYVVGMSDYFDGYQIKYPCEQILPEEKQKGESVFCVFNACIDNNGKELDRKIFRCDINNTPCDSVMLPNGSVVIGGSVSTIENPFNLKFPLGVDHMAALFIYE